MLYKDLQKKAELIIESISCGSEIGLLMNCLKDLETLKYRVSYEISIKTYTQSKKRKEAYTELLKTEDKNLKKVLNSSTLTKNYMEIEMGDAQLQLDSLVNLLRNIRGSLEIARSLLSTEKDMMTKI